MNKLSASNIYPITEWVVKHSDELIKDIDALATDAKTNPILATYFKEAVVDEMRQHIAGALGLSYEDVSEVVDDVFVNDFIKV